MEFNVTDISIPDKIEWNYEQLKAELVEKVRVYETMVYTEDQIRDAKADRAALNRLKKALDAERRNREVEYMRPFNEFKAQVNEILSIIDKPIAVIDKQVKEYEAMKREEKRELIWQFWNGIEHPSWLDLTDIMSDRWLNASVSLKMVQKELLEKVEKINADLNTIASLPEFSFEAMEVYRATLDLNQAVSEGKRLADIQRRKAEAEKEVHKREAIADPEDKKGDGRQWVLFEARMNVQEALDLKGFFENMHIQYRGVRG